MKTVWPGYLLLPAACTHSWGKASLRASLSHLLQAVSHCSSPSLSEPWAVSGHFQGGCFGDGVPQA